MQHRRTNQGGSVLTFIIIGLALATTVIGGIYLVHQRSQEQTHKPVSTNQNGAKQPQVTNPTPAPTPPKSSTNSSSSSSANKPLASGQIPSTGYQVQSTKLPTTGPIDTAFQLLALASLTAASVAYIRSRHVPATAPSL